MAIRGVLFDKDGTLLDFYATWTNVNWQLVRHLAGGDESLACDLMTRGGYDHATRRVRAGSPLAWASARELAGFFAPELAGDKLEDLVGEFERIFLEGGRRDAKPVARLKETLKKLKEDGYRLGIATTDNEAGIEGSLASFDVLSLFDFAAGCDSGHGMKPGPGMVRGFCTATGLMPEEVAVVGDNIHDMEMGKSAGAGLLIGVLTGTSGREDLLPYADFVFESLADLPGLLGRCSV